MALDCHGTKLRWYCIAMAWNLNGTGVRWHRMALALKCDDIGLFLHWIEMVALVCDDRIAFALECNVTRWRFHLKLIGWLVDFGEHLHFWAHFRRLNSKPGIPEIGGLLKRITKTYEKRTFRTLFGLLAIICTFGVVFGI